MQVFKDTVFLGGVCGLMVFSCSKKKFYEIPYNSFNNSKRFLDEKTQNIFIIGKSSIYKVDVSMFNKENVDLKTLTVAKILNFNGRINDITYDRNSTYYLALNKGVKSLNVDKKKHQDITLCDTTVLRVKWVGGVLVYSFRCGDTQTTSVYDIESQQIIGNSVQGECLGILSLNHSQRRFVTCHNHLSHSQQKVSLLFWERDTIVGKLKLWDNLNLHMDFHDHPFLYVVPDSHLMVALYEKKTTGTFYSQKHINPSQFMRVIDTFNMTILVDYKCDEIYSHWSTDHDFPVSMIYHPQKKQFLISGNDKTQQGMIVVMEKESNEPKKKKQKRRGSEFTCDNFH